MFTGQVPAEKNLSALKSLLSVLAEPLYTIEPATPEESARAERRVREYRKNPASFVPFNGTKKSGVTG
jgi:hypothetical protein